MNIGIHVVNICIVDGIIVNRVYTIDRVDIIDYVCNLIDVCDKHRSIDYRVLNRGSGYLQLNTWRKTIDYRYSRPIIVIFLAYDRYSCTPRRFMFVNYFDNCLGYKYNYNFLF